ncbi:MAG: hypothetical protein ABI480_12640 [Chitinophagaceae bacterium]
MKNSIYRVLPAIIIIALSFFSSCKKNDLPDTTSSKVNLTVKQVNQWLNSQVVHSGELRKRRIAEIENQLDFTGLTIETLHNDLSLVVIPIIESFRTYYDKTGSARNDLLLIVDKSNDIKSAMIANFIPENISTSHHPKENSYSSIFNSLGDEEDGQYIFLTLFDKHMFQMKYKESRMTSMSYLKKKNKAGNAAREGDVCIDWYLITTIYYTDGTSETNEEYIETDCYSGCVPGEKCDEFDGGTGSAPPVTPQMKPENWVVRESVGHTWYVKSYEVVSGMKITGEPSKFTGITHSSSTVFTAPNTASGTWQEQNAVVQLLTEYWSKSEIAGKVTLMTGGIYDVSNLNMWFAPTEFPQ